MFGYPMHRAISIPFPFPAMFRFIEWLCAPEIGSNAHLKEWLLSGKSIEEYIDKYSK